MSIYTEYKLDPDTGDYYYELGERVLLVGLDAYVQNMQQSFLKFKGENWLNPEDGFPFYQTMGTKKVAITELDAIVKNHISNKWYVKQVVGEIYYQLEPSGLLHIEFTMGTDLGNARVLAHAQIIRNEEEAHND